MKLDDDGDEETLEDEEGEVDEVSRGMITTSSNPPFTICCDACCCCCCCCDDRGYKMSIVRFNLRRK